MSSDIAVPTSTDDNDDTGCQLDLPESFSSECQPHDQDNPAREASDENMCHDDTVIDISEPCSSAQQPHYQDNTVISSSEENISPDDPTLDISEPCSSSQPCVDDQEQPAWIPLGGKVQHVSDSGRKLVDTCINDDDFKDETFF